jgi:hypothetical protein
MWNENVIRDFEELPTRWKSPEPNATGRPAGLREWNEMLPTKNSVGDHLVCARCHFPHELSEHGHDVSMVGHDFAFQEFVYCHG